MGSQSFECPLCLSGSIAHYLELPDRFQPDGELYHLYRCRDCRLIFLHPRPGEGAMSRYYPAGEYDPFLETGAAVSAAQKLYRFVKPMSLRGKARLAEKLFTKPGSLLDVGAGSGAFLRVMRVRGWEVYGVEKDAVAAAYGRDKLGLTIFTGDLCEAGEYSTAFDAVTFWHSLEHIHRLKENMQRVKRLVKPGGKLMIALPNPESWEAGFYRRYWAAYDAPRHLWHFPPQTLKDWLIREGWCFIAAKPLLWDPFYICLLSEGMIKGRLRLMRMVFRLPGAALFSFTFGWFFHYKASSLVYVFSKE